MTHHNDLITNDLNLWLAEVSKSCHSSQRRAVEQVARVGKEVQCQSEMPHLMSVQANGFCTFSPATIHSASRSTASVLLMLFSSSLVIITSSSEALHCQRVIMRHRRSTHRPASNTLDAIGLISLLMRRKPSYGRSSRGLTMVACTCARTLDDQL